MSKNLSKGIDRGQGVKKQNFDGSINKEWKSIHWGNTPPKGSTNNHSVSLDEDDIDEYFVDDDDDYDERTI